MLGQQSIASHSQDMSLRLGCSSCWLMYPIPHLQLLGVQAHGLQHIAAFAGQWPASAHVAVLDPSPHDGVPGWPARNLLALLSHHLPGQRVRVIALRAAHGKLSAERSWHFAVQLPEAGLASSSGATEAAVKVGGWEEGTGPNVRSPRSTLALSVN